MQAHALVGRCDTLASRAAPDLDDPVDRPGIEARAVPEDDHGGLDLGAELGEAAAKRSPRSSLPLRAVHRARIGRDLVRSQHDDDVVDRRALPDALEDGVEQDRLLRRAEARRGSRCEHDGRNHGLRLRREGHA